MVQRVCLIAVLATAFLACKTLQPVANQTFSASAPTEVAPTESATAPTLPADPIVMTIGNKQITASEFAQVYKKNLLTADSANTEKSIKDYAELFVNFKLKVLAAEAEGRDTTEAFREELAGYRKQLAQPYLTEKNVSEGLVKEAYDHLKEEVNAAHILISCASDAEPSDTLKAYNKAIEVREKALKGESFTELAKQYSGDPSAAYNGGELGYFTAFQMVYPFELAAYQTPVGKVSMPIRTQFGYHIIKAINRRTSRGKVKVAQIVTRFKPNSTEEDRVAARQKIDEIYAKLQAGEKFETLCKMYSEDASSRGNNGELPAFGVGEMVTPFEEAAFGLEDPGAISKPFQTQYGWHIVKLIEHKDLEPYTTMQAFLRQKVQADSRSNLGKTALVKRLKKDTKFVEDPIVVQDALNKADTTLLYGKWSFAAAGAELNKTIFTVGDSPASVREFYEYVKKNKIPNQGSPQVVMRRMYDEFVNERFIKNEEANLEKKYPDFKALMQEYRDGILLFQMMEQNVWQKSVQDSTGLRAYYEKNKTRYPMPERVNASFIGADSKEVLDQAKQALSQSPIPISRKLNDMLFDKNQTVLTPEQKEKLFDVIVILTKNPDYKVEINGNIDVSERDTVSAGRARSVVKYLVENRIPMTRIIEKDNGKLKIVSRTEKNRNQRVGFMFYTTNRKDLEKHYNTEKSDRLALLDGYFKKGDNKIMDGIPWKIGPQAFEKSGRFYDIIIKKIDTPRSKTLDEARGAVINDYQNYLEKEWVAQLRKQYPVIINEEELKKSVK
ncbi:MAG: peptidylprolyl isomerase [Spirosomataceae bacterium]